MITLSLVYLLAGLVFAAFAVLSATDRANAKRFGNALFWGLVAVSFLFGDRLGDVGNGVLVLGLALIAGFGLLGRGQPATTSPDERRVLSERFGGRLFVPALTLPLVVALGVLVFKPMQIGGQPLFDPKQATLISLALAAVISVLTALILLRQPPLAPLQEGRRLMDTVGWAALLPQMLAALGAVFALAGVGELIGQLVTAWIPLDTRFVAVAVYCLGMAAFTMIMGNAFAAFPVLTAGIGLPILINRFGGDPAVVCAIGMLSGFCGTLMTPLAANFNLVPPALLELPDRYSVIKAQIPTALPVLIANVVLMYVLAFR
jgi:Predicted membrane protein